MEKRNHRPQKISDSELKSLIEKNIELESYIITNHAKIRSEERKIPLAIINDVLLTGFHEKKRDTFYEEFKSLRVGDMLFD